MPNKDLIFRFFGRDETLSASLARISAEGEATQKNFKNAFGKLSGYVALGAAATTAVVVDMAAKFQSQMTLLQTAGGETSKNMATVSNGILNMATQTGTSTTQLAEGMYTVEKAGIRGANGLKVLKAAAEGAKAENVDLGTSTNALTSVMMSYHLGASKAVSVENELVAASGMSKTTMQEFAGALSSVIPVASAAHINFAQVGGAIATLTQHGTSADEATQELANTIRSLQAPSQVAQKAMQQIGLNVVDVSSKLGSRGLTGTIDLITNAIEHKMGPSGLVVVDAFKKSQSATADLQRELKAMPPSLQSLAKGFENGTVSYKQYYTAAKQMGGQQYEMAMGFKTTMGQAQGFNDMLKAGSPQALTFANYLKQVMGGATGLNTALMLGGENMAYFRKATADVSAAAEKGGKNISTWGKTQATFKVQSEQAGAALQVMGITIGTALLPVFTPMVKGVTQFVTGLTQNKAALTAVLSVLGGFAAAMTIAWTAQKMMVLWTGLQKAAVLAGAAAQGIATAAQWAWNAAMDANPIGIIILAIAALVASIMFLATHWKQVTQIMGEVWNWLYKSVIKPVGDAIGVVFKWIYQNIVLPIVNEIKREIREWGDIVHWLYNNVIKPVFAAVGTVFKWVHDSVIQPIVNFIKLEITGWALIIQWLYNNVIKPVFAAIGTTFHWVYDNVIHPVASFISDAITNVGNTIHNVFGGISSFIGNAFQSAVNVVKAPINGLIALINGVIAGLDSVSVKIPSWVPVFGGQTFGVNIPQLPYLASGGVTTSAGLAVVGEHGAEVVHLPRGATVYPHGSQPAAGGLHIDQFVAMASQSPAEIAAELGWRMRWGV